ncbi:MAG TPA: methylamine dehydrogenase accessory protein MauD [Steroidobacteraceae bacterium]|nr:methylamine dehydrogenase accessory protein MauD [Steroidobacteraceae bacterium]
MNALVVSNVVLWIAVVALSLVVWALARQIGVLHERITPVGALMLRKGPQVGEPAPHIDVNDLEGRTHHVAEPREDGRSLLVVFVSPTCPVCKAILPVLKSSRLSERDWLEVVLASDGDVAAHRQYIATHGLEQFVYLNSTPLGMTYQVSRLPYAVIVDEKGILRARGIINSREHLESLFEAKRRGVASLQDYFERAQDSRAA